MKVRPTHVLLGLDNMIAVSVVDTAIILFAVNLLTSSAEQQGNAPQAGKTNKCIDNAADNCILSSENPCNKVEFENADQPPVEGTND